MMINGLLRDTVIAFAVFFASAGLVPHVLLALLAGFLLFYKRLEGLKPEGDDFLIVLFIALAYLNMAFHLHLTKSTAQLTSVGILGMYLTFKIGKSLPQSAILIALLFGMLEGAVVLLKFAFEALPTIIERLSSPESQGIHIVYQERAAGLLQSVGASGFAMLIGIVLLELYKRSLDKRIVLLGYGLMIFGTLCNMSRAAVLALICFYLLLALKWGLRKWAWVARKLPILALMVFLFLVVVIAGFATEYDSELLRALASGRLEIFRNAIQFIWKNFLFGNGSWRYIDTIYRSPGVHAHNAFLEFYATHGAITILIFAYIIRNINSRNIYYLVPLIVFNLFNYSIFYIYSFGDVILFFLLTQIKKEPIEAFEASA